MNGIAASSKELNLIPCESLEELASKLSADLDKGRALRFYNDGILIKDPKLPIVYKLRMKYFDMPTGMAYGAVLDKDEPLNWEPDYFKAVNLADLLYLARMPEWGPSEPILFYGLQSDSNETKKSHILQQQLDSPEYGPESGILWPREVGLFWFEGMDRIYRKNWKRAKVWSVRELQAPSY